MDLSDILIDLALELMEKLPPEKVVQVGNSWCYIVGNILYTSLGSTGALIGISKDTVGVAMNADGDPHHIYPTEIRLPLMDIFNKLNVLLVPA